MENKIVCVAVDHKYDDSMGAYSEFYLWDGEKVFKEGGMYSDLAYDEYSVNASKEELIKASQYMKDNTQEGNNYNKYANNGAGAYTFVGCVVKLARSRKAPNNKDLTVVGFQDRYFNSRFGNWVDSKIVVKDELNRHYTVSVGCVKEVVKGVKDLPFWVI